MFPFEAVFRSRTLYMTHFLGSVKEREGEDAKENALTGE